MGLLLHSCHLSTWLYHTMWLRKRLSSQTFAGRSPEALVTVAVAVVLLLLLVLALVLVLVLVLVLAPNTIGWEWLPCVAEAAPEKRQRPSRTWPLRATNILAEYCGCAARRRLRWS